MRWSARVTAWGAAGVLWAAPAVPWAGPGAAAPESVELFLAIDSVTLATPPGDPHRLGLVAGRALAHGGALEIFDVIFLIDVSGSTGDPSGADIDGDGRVSRGLGRRGGRLWGLLGGGSGGKGGGDSILAAELAAVRSLLETFDARSTRVGIVTFSGGANASADHAWVEVPLTSAYSRIRSALDQILLAGPQDATNMYAGLRLAGIELGGGRSAESSRRRGAQRHIVLLTDGFPTLPRRDGLRVRESTEPEDRAIAMARILGARKMPVRTFAIGRDATERPRAAVQVARASRGEFTAVVDPADLGRLLAEVQFSRIETLRVRNRTNGLDAVDSLRNADGGYAALVPVAEGSNTIEVIATATDGSTRRLEVTTVIGSGRLTPRQTADLVRLRQILRAREQKTRHAERAVEIEVEPD